MITAEDYLKKDKKHKVEGHIVNFEVGMEGEDQVSLDKWEEFYDRRNVEVTDQEKKEYGLVYGQLPMDRLNKDGVFVEVGCGKFVLGQMVAPQVKLVVGVDFSYKALKIADRLMQEAGITNYLLIRADITQMPLQDKSVDMIYGGGVIEHFEDVKSAIGEFGRVLKTGGTCINAVPIVNIGALTYRQMWGNIPEVPVLRNILKWIHFKLLKGKHLVFGYERSYRVGQLIQWHRQAGFDRVKMTRFETDIQLDFLPKFTKKYAKHLAETNWLFWPMAKFIATK